MFLLHEIHAMVLVTCWTLTILPMVDLVSLPESSTFANDLLVQPVEVQNVHSRTFYA